MATSLCPIQTCSWTITLSTKIRLYQLTSCIFLTMITWTMLVIIKRSTCIVIEASWTTLLWGTVTATQMRCGSKSSMNSKVAQNRLRGLASTRVCMPNHRSWQGQSTKGSKGWAIAWTDGSSVISSSPNICTMSGLATMKAKILICVKFSVKVSNHLSIDNHASQRSRRRELRI